MVEIRGNTTPFNMAVAHNWFILFKENEFQQTVIHEDFHAIAFQTHNAICKEPVHYCGEHKSSGVNILRNTAV